MTPPIVVAGLIAILCCASVDSLSRPGQARTPTALAGFVVAGPTRCISVDSKKRPRGWLQEEHSYRNPAALRPTSIRAVQTAPTGSFVAEGGILLGRVVSGEGRRLYSWGESGKGERAILHVYVCLSLCVSCFLLGA